ncbi:MULTISPECIES: DUF4249 family protein [unclassified Arcicella]|uniref:DUF4249 family protein n=1 Tax=unclassified Arcicella TaxID=2644986 RepID=UPI0028653FE8|nr:MULTISPECIES: DUF4249 family protein [unclassified Arcicella]MDR6560463.1 hypothetical protein [Arcicella sp. BE51]MDR6809931.1 hypothetical protein [Arcicella sp. BE140]MDR6821280.1 hypothetical protein [Arcicella sp. BE139]
MKSYIKFISSKNNLLAIIIFASLLGIVACDKDSNFIEGGARPVVEAYLVAGKPISLSVKKEIAYNEDTSNTEAPINGLNIKISDGTNTYSLTSNGAGVYKSDSTVKLKVGVTYNLSFTYNGNAVTASTIIPTKPVGFKTDITSIARTKLNLSSGGGFGGGFVDGNEDVNLSWSNPNSDYHFVVVDNIEANPVLIITLPTTTNFNDLTRRFRSQPIQGTSTQLRSQQFQYFGKHNLVLLKVNPDYAALYNSTGSTSQNISTPPTTITNGLGIFTGVNADTLAFTVKQK